MFSGFLCCSLLWLPDPVAHPSHYLNNWVWPPLAPARVLCARGYPVVTLGVASWILFAGPTLVSAGVDTAAGPHMPPTAPARADSCLSFCRGSVRPCLAALSLYLNCCQHSLNSGAGSASLSPASRRAQTSIDSSCEHPLRCVTSPTRRVAMLIVGSPTCPSTLSLLRLTLLVCATVLEGWLRRLSGSARVPESRA